MDSKAWWLGLVLVGSSVAFAAEPSEVVNDFLAATQSTEASTSNLSESNARVEKPQVLKSLMRLAATPKSILRLSDENKRLMTREIVSPPSLDTSEKDEKRAAAEAKKAESAVDRKMHSLDRSLRREEQRLESRLKELASKRNKALEKGDEDTLKRVERAEKQAVVDYERRINRLLAAMSKGASSPVERAIGSRTPTANPTNSRAYGLRAPSLPRVPSSLKQTIPSWNRTNQAGRNVKSAQPPANAAPPAEKPGKRRFKLWPFR